MERNAKEKDVRDTHTATITISTGHHHPQVARHDNQTKQAVEEGRDRCR